MLVFLEEQCVKSSADFPQDVAKWLLATDEEMFF